MKEEQRTGTLKHHDLAASDRERVLDRVAGSLAFVEATCLQAMDMACLLRESLQDLLGSGAPDRAQRR